MEQTIVKPAPAFPGNVDYQINQLKWNRKSCLQSDKGAPFIDQTESGAPLAMGDGMIVAEHGVWLHPNHGPGAFAEIEINLTQKDVSKFVAVFGLSDEYLAVCNGYNGTVDEGLRSVQFVFLVDGEVVESYDFVNVVKLGTTVIDLEGASTLPFV